MFLCLNCSVAFCYVAYQVISKSTLNYYFALIHVLCQGSKCLLCFVFALFHHFLFLCSECACFIFAGLESVPDGGGVVPKGLDDGRIVFDAGFGTDLMKGKFFIYFLLCIIILYVFCIAPSCLLFCWLLCLWFCWLLIF